MLVLTDWESPPEKRRRKLRCTGTQGQSALWQDCLLKTLGVWCDTREALHVRLILGLLIPRLDFGRYPVRLAGAVSRWIGVWQL